MSFLKRLSSNFTKTSFDTQEAIPVIVLFFNPIRLKTWWRCLAAAGASPSTAFLPSFEVRNYPLGRRTAGCRWYRPFLFSGGDKPPLNRVSSDRFFTVLSEVPEDGCATIRRGRSGQDSSPYSRPTRSPGQTSPERPRFRRLPPGPGAGCSSRISGPHECRST